MKKRREFDDRKLAYVDETASWGNQGKQFPLIFYDLEPSHINAVDAWKVSKVWVE